MAGNALLLHPDEVHDGRAGAAGGFRYRMVYIEPRLIRDALGGGVNTLPFVRRPVSSDARLVGPVASALDDLDANVEDLAADQRDRWRHRARSNCPGFVPVCRLHIRELPVANGNNRTG